MAEPVQSAREYDLIRFDLMLPEYPIILMILQFRIRIPFPRDTLRTCIKWRCC